MTHLRAISGETVNNPNGYSQISYDLATGELLEAWHAGDYMTSWTQYREPSVILVCKTRRHMTMQQLADSVRDAVAEYKYIQSQL